MLHYETNANSFFDFTNIEARILCSDLFIMTQRSVKINVCFDNTETSVRCFNKKKLIVSHRVIQHD